MRLKSLILSITVLFSVAANSASIDDYTYTVNAPPREIQSVLRAWAENPDYLPPDNMFTNMAQFPTGEIFTVALVRLEHWFYRDINLDDPNNVLVKKMIFRTIKLLGAIGQKEVHYYNPENGVLEQIYAKDTLESFVELVEKHLFNRPYMEQLRNELIAAKQRVEGKPASVLGSLNLVIARRMKEREAKNKAQVPLLDNRSKKEAPTESDSTVARREGTLGLPGVKRNFDFDESRIEKFKTHLERIRGQQRVKDRYLNVALEIKTMGIGHRTRPYVTAYKMGSPGNGKDTSTEALVDGLFDQIGAYQKLDGGIPMFFRLPVMRRDADLWKVIGSNTGYKGSEGITPFIRWLVKFSAGRYEIKQDTNGPMGMGMKEGDPYIIENPNWKPGMVLDGYFPPELGVLFANEFHNWSRNAKDEFLKQFIEKGYVSLNNPGKGVAELYVPVNIDIASNEGIGLMSPREADGRVVGNRPKTYEETQAAYELYADRPDILRDEILKTNAFDGPNVNSEYRRGISEETLNRISDSELILMENTSPENLRLIARDKLAKLGEVMDAATGYYGSISFEPSEALVNFIQEYHYNPEANARPIEDKVNTVVRDTIFDAIKQGLIKGNNNGKGHQFKLDIEVQQNKVAFLVFNDFTSGRELFRQEVRVTRADIPKMPVQNEKIKAIGMAKRLKDNVYGVDQVLEKLEMIFTNIQASQNRARKEFSDHSPAQKIALLGISGVGKTEVAKEVAADQLPGGADDLFVVDFNTLTTEAEVTKKFYGEKNGESYIKSDFMNQYDRGNGTVYVLLEEVVNAALTNPRILVPLYPLFDESVVKLFSDNKPRPMTNVVFVLNGNVGAQMYQAIPKNIPETEKMTAYVEMFRQFLRDRGAQRRALEKEMPVALVNRIPENNIIWFGPQNFDTARRVTMKLVGRNVEKMKVLEGDRGWDVMFDSEKDYLRMVDLVEEAAFTAETQGRGIRNYINGSMSEGTLRYLLVKNNVASGSQVVLKARQEKYEREFRGTISSIYAEASDNDVIYDVLVSDGRTLEWRLERNERQYFPTINPEDQIITAAHEAGHNIVGQVLMGDKDMNDMITIIPGVANIEDQWIRYLGLASTDEKEIMIMTKQAFIEQAARLLGGAEAQKLVTIGARDDSGKSNDIERANAVLTYAILKAGVFPEWGNYKANSPSDLTGDRRKLYEKLLNQSLKQAQALARKTLLLNYDSHLVPMMLVLAEKGIVLKPELDKFYSERTVKNPYKYGAVRELTTSSAASLKARFASRYKPTTRDSKLLPHLPRPQTVSGTGDFVKAQKEKIVSQVPIPNSAPIRGKTSMKKQLPVGGSCLNLFGGN